MKQVFCSTSLPLARTRWVPSTLSSHCPLSSNQRRWLTSVTSNIFHKWWESNPGQLGEKQVCYLCAMQPPSPINKFVCQTYDQRSKRKNIACFGPGHLSAGTRTRCTLSPGIEIWFISGRRIAAAADVCGSNGLNGMERMRRKKKETTTSTSTMTSSSTMTSQSVQCRWQLFRRWN